MSYLRVIVYNKGFALGPAILLMTLHQSIVKDLELIIMQAITRDILLRLGTTAVNQESIKRGLYFGWLAAAKVDTIFVSLKVRLVVKVAVKDPRIKKIVVLKVINLSN